MFNANLIVVGAGGHARSCIDTIEQEGKYVIGGLVGLVEEVGSKQFDYEVLTADSGLAQLAKRFRYALIAVGQIHSPELRIRLYNQYLAAGFIFPTIISKVCLRFFAVLIIGIVINYFYFTIFRITFNYLSVKV